MTPDIMPAAAEPSLPQPPPTCPGDPVVTPLIEPIVASVDARHIAGAILEVLAGIRTITDVALTLGIAPARYYVLEARAVAGLIAACEPRGHGPHAGGGLVHEVERLRGDRDRLRDEVARYQALLRIAQTAFAPQSTGGPPPAASTTTGLSVRQQRAARAAAAREAPLPPGVSKPRKKRVATVRALRLAQQVQGTQMSHRATMTAAIPPDSLGSQRPGDRAP